MDERSALFVRLPSPLVSRLDAHIRADGRTKQAVVEDLLSSQLAVDANVELHDDEILDLTAVAAFLRVDESDVLDRIATGDFPARRFGDQWRCSRAAVLTWLAGTDPPTTRPTGFSA
ncbi:MAG: helix-turn-helix domain-containing protein [Ilumatobacter sp.]|uniref:helix-turn-helix domain-containing protein n=1 Tax=Ilumatobacter sp. TaxID=1967498 RepID=UPI00261DB4EF|nr:helix-turn-helix domain-containing protein [Ilumatobacter sp.]MDJ0770032.1 helix-turn-helix domain-containing protein [Ilumatobacter sp.]